MEVVDSNHDSNSGSDVINVAGEVSGSDVSGPVEYNSSFMRRKRALDDKVLSMERDGFFLRVDRSKSILDGSVESCGGISTQVVEDLKSSFCELQSLESSFDDVIPFISGASSNGQRFERCMAGIASVCGMVRPYVKSQINEYFSTVRNVFSERVGDDRGVSANSSVANNSANNIVNNLASIDRFDCEAVHFLKLAELLDLEHEYSALRDVRSVLHSSRKKIFDDSSKKIPDVDKSWNFFRDYDLRIVGNDSVYSLEVVKSGRSILRWSSDNSIADDRKIRKEIIADLLKVDDSLDEDVLEKKLLDCMVNVRGVVDDYLKTVGTAGRSGKKFVVSNVSSKDSYEAMNLLKCDDLLFRAKELIGVKVAGEEHLSLANYVVSMGSKFACPANIPQGLFVRSLSGSGKTYVSKTSLSLIPDDNVFKIVDTTDKVLKYLREDLWGKIFFVEEWTKLSDGIAKILRQLLSGSGDSEALVVGRDGGSFKTERLRMNGTPAFISGTVLNELEDQLANRCWLVYTDITPLQTRRILEFQSRYGVVGKRSDDLFNAGALPFRNAYGLLQSVGVVNPFCGVSQSFLGGVDVADRRQGQKLDGFVKTVSLINQFQRQRVDICGEEYAVSTLGDLYSSFRILEPFLKLSFSRISHDAQTAYQALNSLCVDGAGVSVSDFRNCSLLDVKGLNHQSPDKDFVRECLDELERNGFASNSDGVYFPVKQKFDLNGCVISRSLLERNVKIAFGDNGELFEMCGFVYDRYSGGFLWDLYRESVVDPITGVKKKLSFDCSDVNNLRVVVS